MKKRGYISILLIICLSASISILSSACICLKNNKPLINHKSKYQQLMDKYNQPENPSNVIDLSDGKKINYDAQVGPNDPNFGMQPISSTP